MKSVRTWILAMIALLALSSRATAATDQERYEKLAGKYGKADLIPIGKTACWCDGSGEMGYLRAEQLPSKRILLTCFVPNFDASGAWDGGNGCGGGAFRTIAR